eukprot:CAMPEP_0205859012 /NCGR_PEP_ID=MMETSP1083-20121108/4503_1 /ASSEMBLY_ACC=CAM_ASM_000430 /TAXON_ID=97485 /ORGANISM="Prymnesium parvum, Strain Texoma1" /LENGTH=132 /DNA_ID=CAMNT_0053220609 /DNA_START=100 /DNA_END=496 /DNA_ORIENTATION=-
MEAAQGDMIGCRSENEHDDEERVRKKRTFSRAHMQMWAVLNMRAVRANFIARLYPSATVASILQLQVIINDEEQQRYQVASCLYERDALLEEDNSAEDDHRIPADGQQLEHHHVGTLNHQERGNVDEEAEKR